MTKKILRQKYLNLRKQYSLEELEQLSILITKKLFLQVNFLNIRSIHLFLPIKKQCEINTFLIINQLKKDFPQIDIIISKSNFQTFEMESFLLENNTILEDNIWGIPEPKEAKPYIESEIDMILMPLLIFDKKGYRVGYGKGFYDRFLTKCKSDIIKIGLSLFEAIEEIEGIEETDVPLDYVISPENFYQF